MPRCEESITRPGRRSPSASFNSIQIYKTSEAFRCWSTVTQTTKTDFIKLAGAGQLGGHGLPVVTAALS